MKSISKTLKSFVLLFVLLLLAFPEVTEAFRDLPEDRLAYPVLILLGNNTGSGFYYNKDEKVYLVTARHVLFDLASAQLKELPKNLQIPPKIRHRIAYDGDKHQLLFNGVMSTDERDELLKLSPKNRKYKKAIEKLFQISQQLRLKSSTAILLSYSPETPDEDTNEIVLQLAKLYEENKVKQHPHSDVAAVRIGTVEMHDGQDMIRFVPEATIKRGTAIKGISQDSTKLFDDVLTGNAVFVFGYPTSLSTSPHLDIRKPLLRKGIIAGKNKIHKTIVLDCPMYFGNSGGLVIEVEREPFGEHLKAIGVVSAFVAFEKKWIENSGYSVAIPMDFVQELLAEN